MAKVPRDAPSKRICLLGCGITTGFGAATKTMDVFEGATVAVFGLGAVGLAVVMGCKSRGCARIIGVDINPDKEATAREFGITEFLNPANHPDVPVQQVLVDMTGGGLDFTFECIGRPETMRAALEACHKGWGRSCIIGVAAAGQEISTRPFQLVTGRSWHGTAFGGFKGRSELPGLVDDYIAGKVKVDEFVSHEFASLADLNEAFDVMHRGEAIRSVVRMAEDAE